MARLCQVSHTGGSSRMRGNRGRSLRRAWRRGQVAMSGTATQPSATRQMPAQFSVSCRCRSLTCIAHVGWLGLRGTDGEITTCYLLRTLWQVVCTAFSSGPCSTIPGVRLMRVERSAFTVHCCPNRLQIQSILRLTNCNTQVLSMSVFGSLAQQIGSRWLE